MSQRKISAKTAEIDLESGDFPSLSARVWARETPWIHISGFKLPKIRHMREGALPRHGFQLPTSRDFAGDDVSSLQEILARLTPGEVVPTSPKIDFSSIWRWIAGRAA